MTAFRALGTHAVGIDYPLPQNLSTAVEGSSNVDAQENMIFAVFTAVVGSAEAQAELIYPEFFETFVVTPRPPTSLKDVSRNNSLDLNQGGWTTVATSFKWQIPPSSNQPGELVDAVFLLSNVQAASRDGEAQIEIRVVDAANDPLGIRDFMVFPSITVPASGFLRVPVDGMNLKEFEVLQVRSLNGESVDVSVSYVMSSAEQFEVLS